jgi:FKBP-type peptidyl-prolyl cis-trans isomerase (trigger factor)
MPIIAVKNYKGVEVERVKNAPSAKNAEMRLKDAIIDKVLEANDIEVPQDLVDDEVTMMILELNHKMKYESLASSRYIGFTQDDIADRMEKFKKEAYKLVKTRLVLKGIIEAENFEVTKEELEEEAKAISVRQQMPIEMVKDFLGEDLEPLKGDLLVRKAIDFVIANAIIK